LWKISTPHCPGQAIQKKRIKKDILELNNTMDEIDLTDINRVFHPMRTD
jgi:hypothetical protein